MTDKVPMSRDHFWHGLGTLCIVCLIIAVVPVAAYIALIVGGALGVGVLIWGLGWLVNFGLHHGSRLPVIREIAKWFDE